jgi:hypothetical protein
LRLEFVGFLATDHRGGGRLVVGGGVARPRAGRGSLLTKEEEGRWKPKEEERQRSNDGAREEEESPKSKTRQGRAIA